MQGHFWKSDKQSFPGKVYNNCKGTMNFRDKGKYSFQYDESKCTIFWIDQQAGKKWEKGKYFYNLRFIQNNNLSRKNSESNKIIETSKQKYHNKYLKNLCRLDPQVSLL